MASERDFVRWLRDLHGSSSRDVVVGIGDDAAVVQAKGRELVVTCDPVVEGVHFGSNAPPSRVGRKAVNRNLSDLAAMGAVPDYLVVSALLPRHQTAQQRRSMFVGVQQAAEAGGCLVVGGDVGATPGPLTLTVTAFGHLRGKPMRRDAARVHDTIHVTGPLGGSGLGGHLRFRPHIAEGLWLGGQSGVRAATDVSDGLALDLSRMLEASGGLGAELREGALPVSAAARRAARSSGRSGPDHALHDGEDHVLLFTLRRGVELSGGGPLSDLARRPIGVITREPSLVLVGESGAKKVIPASGYEHDI